MNLRPQLLITGASGFTGRHACQHFSEIGYDVTAITRNPSSIGFEDMKIEYCELTNKKEVTVLVKKVRPDYLLHLAGQNHVGDSWKDPIATLEANLLSTAYLIDAVRQERPSCKIVIVGSALQFDPNNISTLAHPYSLSKTLQELIAQAWEKLFKMNIVIAKPSNLIGPGCSTGVNAIFASKIAKMEENKLEKVLVVNNLNARRDFLDVRDAVSAYEILLKKGESGEIYDIASGKSRSLGELINIYKTLTNVNFDVQSFSDAADFQVEEVEPLSLIDLGWSKSFSLETSLKDTLDYFREK